MALIINSLSDLMRWSPLARGNGSDDSIAAVNNRVVASDVTDVVEPVHANQRVEKSWTVTATPASDEDCDATHSLIQQLQIKTPGLTVVSVRPQLQDELGRDVAAHVRVTSDTREHLDGVRVQSNKMNEYTVDFQPIRAASSGHLVTEITVPRIGHVHGVVAMGNGDVVVQDGVVGRSTAIAAQSSACITSDAIATATTASSEVVYLLSLFGARVFLNSPEKDLNASDVFLGTFGSGSVDVFARDVAIDKDFAAVVLGDGRTSVHAQSFSSQTVDFAALGDGSALLATKSALHTRKLVTFLHGAGSVHARVLDDQGLGQSVHASIHVSHNGRVDIADVTAFTAKVHITRPSGGSVSLQAPAEKLVLDCTTSRRVRGLVEYVGDLPTDVKQIAQLTPSEMLAPLSVEELTAQRELVGDMAPRAAIPTIEHAFETPVVLDKVNERWWQSFVAPIAHALRPF